MYCEGLGKEVIYPGGRGCDRGSGCGCEGCCDCVCEDARDEELLAAIAAKTALAVEPAMTESEVWEPIVSACHQ